MPSPCSGMAPYLESSGLWQDGHPTRLRQRAVGTGARRACDTSHATASRRYRLGRRPAARAGSAVVVTHQLLPRYPYTLPSVSYTTRTRNKPWAGAVGPACCRWPECRMVGMASAAICPRPIATSVPTMLRAMCCRKPSAQRTKTRRAACRVIRRQKRWRHGLRAVQDAARKAEKSCHPTRTLAAARMAGSSSACGTCQA